MVSNGEHDAIILARLANIFSSFLIISAFTYSCHLSSNKKDRKISRWQKLIIIIFSAFFLIINLIPNLTITNIKIVKASFFIINFGPYTVLFFFTFVLVSLLTAINLLSNKNKTKIKRIESIYIAIGFIITSTTTILTSVIVTYACHDFALTWLPPALSVVELMIVGYTMIYHRFYSFKYLSYIFLNIFLISLLYLSILFIILWKFPESLKNISAIIWTISYSANWKLIWKFTSIYISLWLYHQKEPPVKQIKKMSKEFKSSTFNAIKKISDLLYLDQETILFSDTITNDLYYSYLSKNNSALLIDELEYYVDRTDDIQLVKIRDQMSLDNSAIILPLYDLNHVLSRLFIASHKKNGALFTIEEISALKQLLKNIQTYIFSEYHIKQSQAIAQSIAHEMRNPLSQIQLRLEKIDSESTNMDCYLELHHEITQAKNAIYHGNQIIDLMLQEANQPTIDPQSIHPYSISQLGQAVISDYAFDSEITQKRVTFNHQSDFTIAVNDVLFSFILFNLLRNAIYYFNEYPESTIEITLEIAEQENLLHFKDYGPGIEKHIQQRIFDDFFTYQKSGGTGLGLSYCQRVMNLFNGYISCDSVFGQYTVFTLHFPKVDQAPMALPEMQESSLATSPPKAKSGSDSVIYALVTDDNRSQRQLLRFYLEKLGINVEEAENGRQAIEKVQRCPLNLVFMDIRMPVMDGFQACKSIKALYPTLPVIAFSGETEDETMLQINQHMDDRLAKPTTKEHLETILTKWVPHFTSISKIE
ncbi:ATP-binding response regulator [Celerinatantimonas diazotrophica]|uniref:ATP-binding response regulator n=1 Tax=Celerinatantimonas diazotrophica TaxID=412034 RepID=UPI001404B9E8|nr:hybrid sensor histidine kinase/response regulator [Celerinatantimonas diazotrophica]